MRNILLFIPLLFFVLLWFGVFFGIDLIPDGLLRDDTFVYSGDGLRPTGFISQSTFNLIGFVAMVPGFFVGLICTIYNRLWRWFCAYMLIGGVPVGIYGFAVMWAHITQ